MYIAALITSPLQCLKQNPQNSVVVKAIKAGRGGHEPIARTFVSCIITSHTSGVGSDHFSYFRSGLYDCLSALLYRSGCFADERFALKAPDKRSIAMSHKKRCTIDGGMARGIVGEEIRMLYEKMADVENMETLLQRSLEADERHLETLDVMEQMRLRWANVELRCQQQGDEIVRLSQKLEEEKSHSAALELQLKQAKASIASLSAEKQIMEVELAALKRKFERGRDLLKDDSEPKPSSSSYAYRSRSSKKSSLHFNDASIDFDVTGDSLDDVVPELPSIKNKRSRGAVADAVETEQDENDVTPNKRSRDYPSTPQSTLISKESPKKQPIRRSMNRSFSESNLLDSKEMAKREVFGDLNGRCAKTPSSTDVRSPHMAGFGPSWTNGFAIESRPHRYQELSSMTSIMSYCDVCNKKFGVMGKRYKCIDCHMTFHHQCRQRAPIPCVPRCYATPKTPSKTRPRLRDFCPNSRPMIPYIMIHSIVALEKDRLSNEGIYRVPGNDARVVRLLNDLKKASPLPKLWLEDTETITSCLKKFLRDLNDSLIPMTSFLEFSKAADSQDPVMLKNAVNDLPITNRDTLAYLCLHLQKVAENSQINRMPLENLARCIAPSVVGESHLSRCAKMSTVEASGVLEKQINIMVELLRMPTEYWKQFIDTTYSGMYQSVTTPNSVNTPSNVGSHMSSARRQLVPRSPATPLSSVGNARTAISYADHSMLGPIRTPPTGSANTLIQPVSRRGKPLFDQP
uniref:Rac GTPase-activating protein 1-like n=1 Tax=Steinernema glaseri TaxID=37863 RepID=A0A1I8AQZ0_9BILA